MKSSELVMELLSERGRSKRSLALELGITPQALDHRLSTSPMCPSKSIHDAAGRLGAHRRERGMAGDELPGHGAVEGRRQDRVGRRADTEGDPGEGEDIRDGGDRREVEESGVMMV